MPDLVPRWLLDDYVIDLAWSPCGTWLAAAESGGPLWLLSQRSQVRCSGHRIGTTSLSWCSTSVEPCLASCGQDGMIHFWGPASASPWLSSPAPDPWCNRLAWYRKKSLLAVAGGKQVAFYDGQGRHLATSEPHLSSLADLAWMPHEATCLTVGYLGLQAWNLENSLPLRRYEWQGSSLRLAISPNQSYIATGDQDCTVHFWRRRHNRPEDSAMMSGFATKVEQLSWHYQSRTLATGGSSDICLWDCRGQGPEGRPPVILKGNASQLITALAYQPQGDWLASGDEAGQLCLWRPDHSPLPLVSYQLASKISTLNWSPKGKSLAVACAEGQVYLTGLDSR